LKKLLATLAVLATMGVAHADTTIVTGYGANTNNVTKADSDQFVVRVMHDINTIGTSVDGIVTTSKNQSTNGLTNQYELGVSQKFPVNAVFIPYIRAAVGTIQVSKVDPMYYAGIEPGVIIKPTGTPFTIKLDYTRGTGINGTKNLDIDMYRTQVGYAITDKDSIAVRKDWIRGDMNTDTYWLTYARRF